MVFETQGLAEGERSVTQKSGPPLTWVDVVEALYFRYQISLNLSKRKEDEEQRILLVAKSQLYLSIAQRLSDEVDQNYRDGL